MRNDAVTAELALTIVRDQGSKINLVNVIAAETYRYGRPGAAAAVLKIADAIEIHWIPRESGFRTTDTGKPDGVGRTLNAPLVGPVSARMRSSHLMAQALSKADLRCWATCTATF